MESTNAFEITSGPRAVECVPNINADEDSTKVQVNEVSSAVASNISKCRDEKNTENPSTEEEKLSQKRKMVTEDRQPLKRKKNNSLPISQMVMESIRGLKKRNGASVKVILEHMEGQYKVNAKLARRHVTRYLLSAVEKGILEELSGAGSDGRYKIKKSEKITKVEQKSKGNRMMVKLAKVGRKSNNNQKMLKAGKVAKVEKKPNQRKAKGEKVAKVK